MNYLEDHDWDLLYAASARVGLTLGMGVVLQALQERGACSSGMLAAAIKSSPVAITHRIDALVAKGLVERSGGKDRRIVYVAFTEAGKALVERMEVRARTERMVAWAAERKLTPNQAAVLVCLVRHSRGMVLARVGRHVGISTVAALEMTRKLRGAGLVEKNPDGRGVRITEAGVARLSLEMEVAA